MTAPTRRLFFGVGLDDEARKQLTAVAQRLRTTLASEGIFPRWTPDEGWHCTLKFLGPVAPEGVKPLIEDAAMLSLPARIAAAWAGIGAFPSAHRARILVVHLADTERILARCALDLEQVAESYGIPREKRPYRPHITLARFRLPVSVPSSVCREGGPLAGSITLGPVTLYESELRPEGSRYRPMWTSSDVVPSP